MNRELCGITETYLSPLLGRVDAHRRTGAEQLHRRGTAIPGDLLDLWRWSASDFLTNTARGLLAEYIVAKALDVSTSGVRDGWAVFDLLTPSGIKVEVKSGAYLQSWFQDKLSAISFSTKQSTAWNPDTNKFEGTRRQQADVYVFALLAHKDKATLDPLDVTQWEFYVAPTRTLAKRPGNPASISLGPLRKLGVSACAFGDLAAAVRSVFEHLSA